MKQGKRSRLVSVVVVLAVLTASMLFVAGPAQAYTCSTSRSLTVTGDVSKTTITFYPHCSDGKSHWSGTLWDTKCDGRSARVVLVANQQYGVWQWDHGYNAGNGCGTYSTYSGFDNSVVAYAGVSWAVEVSVGACSWSCSSYTRGYLHN
jgi:hypothetical protein